MTDVKQILNKEFLDTLDDHQVQQDGELPTDEEDTSWCEVGEHYVNELDMWEDLADCKNCVSEKEMLELIEDYEDYEGKTKEEQEEEMWTQTIIDEEKEDEP